MKLFIMTCVISLSLNSLAAQKAKVKFVKGKVTKLSPGQTKASKVKKGEQLTEDTSIVTGQKSFVRVIFADKSSMNVGPNSKVIINKMPKTKANMVNLLTGIIKAEVKKNSPKKSKNKMLVKTRTAVMGVRGTKFQSTYNPANKTTSLVTVEGKVAIAKIKEEVSEVESIKSESMSADSASSSGNVATKAVPEMDEAAKLDKILEESVEVPAGRYSGVVQAVEKPTVPVKIAPKQYNVIAKSMGSKNKAVDVMKTTDKDPTPEGFENKATGEFAPKAGGIIDFSTGIYVAPTAAAVLDKKTGTFDTKEIGKVDSSTGDYVPPRGIKIDEKKGFIVDTKTSEKLASNEDKKELQKTIAKLNNEVVKKQIVVNKVESKPTSQKVSRWLPKNHIVSAQFKPYSEVLTVKNKLGSSEADFYTEKANWVILTLKQEWNEKWTSRFRIGSQDYEIDESDVKVFDFGGDDGGDNYVSIGVGYKYSEKMNILLDVVERSEYYVVPTSDGSGDGGVSVKSETVKTLDLGLEYFIRDWKKFKVSTTGTLHLSGDNSVPSPNGGEDKADQFGFSFSGDAYYSWKKNMGVNTSLWYSRVTAEAEDIDYKRHSFGLGVDFVWDV